MNKNKSLFGLNKQLANSLKSGTQKSRQLKKKYTDLMFEMTMPAGFADTFEKYDL